MKYLVLTIMLTLSLPAISCIDVEPGYVTPPSLEVFIPPAWSKSHGSAPAQGVAEVYLDIDATGKVTKVKLLKVSPESIPTEKLVKAIKRSKFSPAKQEGKPVSISKHWQAYEFPLE